MSRTMGHTADIGRQSHVPTSTPQPAISDPLGLLSQTMDQSEVAPVTTVGVIGLETMLPATTVTPRLVTTVTQPLVTMGIHRPATMGNHLSLTMGNHQSVTMGNHPPVTMESPHPLSTASPQQGITVSTPPVTTEGQQKVTMAIQVTMDG